MRPEGGGVRDAADLARLPAPADAILETCRRVVEAFSDLPDDDVATRPPPHPAGVHDVLRDDEPVPGLTTEEALAAAPDAIDDTFRTARVRDVA